MTQHREKKLNEILNLIKGQGHQQATQPQPSDSSTSNTSPPPPLPPPPPYNSNCQPISQHKPLIIYPPKDKIELSKYNGGDNQCVAWFNKTEEYFHIYNITTDEEKVKYASMYLKGIAYNWYLWWKEEFSHIIGILSKMIFFKDSRASQIFCFSKLTKLQQKGSIDEFMHQWESLATRVFGLSDDQLLHSYIGGLKPHIQDKLILHEVTTVEIEIRKAKAAEEKLEGQSRFNKVYSRRSVPQTTGNEKYIPPNLREDIRRSSESQRIKEGKCKRCGEKWDPRHRCQIKDNSKKLYTCEVEKDVESESTKSINEEMKNFQNDTLELIEDNTLRIARNHHRHYPTTNSQIKRTYQK
jgi:hypothetical protein